MTRSQAPSDKTTKHGGKIHRDAVTKPTGPEEGDRRRVTRASRSIGLAVGATTAIITVVGAAALIIWISLSSRPDGERGAERIDIHGQKPMTDDLVVDTNRLIIAIVILGFLGMLVLAVIAWLVARRAVRPLAEALRLQRNFVADASHELRTPLTVLSTRVQLLQRRLQRGETTDDITIALRDDVEALTSVLDDLLASAESAATSTETISDLAAVAEEAATRLAPLADAVAITVTTHADSRPTVSVPATTLSRCLTAVIDNAIQHSPNGSHVTVEVSATGKEAIVRVSNPGGRISADDATQIFERFRHGQESGRRRSFGLGLALVRDIVSRHGGTISVDLSGSVDYTVFVITLPLARQ